MGTMVYMFDTSKRHVEPQLAWALQHGDETTYEVDASAAIAENIIGITGASATRHHYNGAEVVVVLFDGNEYVTEMLVDRIKQLCQEQPLSPGNSPAGLQVSIGGAHLTGGAVRGPNPGCVSG